MVEAPWSSGQGLKASTPGMGFNSQMMQFLHQEVWVSIPGECELCRKNGENNYKKIFSIAQRVPTGMDLIGRLRVMQSDVNPHKAGKIVGCNIVYVIFLIVCNSIITRKKRLNLRYIIIV